MNSNVAEHDGGRDDGTAASTLSSPQARHGPPES